MSIKLRHGSVILQEELQDIVELLSTNPKFRELYETKGKTQRSQSMADISPYVQNGGDNTDGGSSQVQFESITGRKRERDSNEDDFINTTQQTSVAPSQYFNVENLRRRGSLSHMQGTWETTLMPPNFRVPKRDTNMQNYTQLAGSDTRSFQTELEDTLNFTPQVIQNVESSETDLQHEMDDFLPKNSSSKSYPSPTFSQPNISFIQNNSFSPIEYPNEEYTEPSYNSFTPSDQTFNIPSSSNDSFNDNYTSEPFENFSTQSSSSYSNIPQELDFQSQPSQPFEIQTPRNIYHQHSDPEFINTNIYNQRSKSFCIPRDTNFFEGFRNQFSFPLEELTNNYQQNITLPTEVNNSETSNHPMNNGINNNNNVCSNDMSASFAALETGFSQNTNFMPPPIQTFHGNFNTASSNDPYIDYMNAVISQKLGNSNSSTFENNNNNNNDCNFNIPYFPNSGDEVLNNNLGYNVNNDNMNMNNVNMMNMNNNNMDNNNNVVKHPPQLTRDMYPIQNNNITNIKNGNLNTSGNNNNSNNSMPTAINNSSNGHHNITAHRPHKNAFNIMIQNFDSHYSDQNKCNVYRRHSISHFPVRNSPDSSLNDDLKVTKWTNVTASITKKYAKKDGSENRHSDIPTAPPNNDVKLMMGKWKCTKYRVN